MEPLWEFIGWTGAAVILSAYLAVSMSWIRTGRAFQTANLLGACAFIVNGAVHQAWPSVATNIAWFLISAIALLRLRASRRTPQPVLDPPQVQFPGVPDTTCQLAVVEILTSPTGDVDQQRSLHQSRQELS
ncbi:conserved hypothetical protein [Arthrobacter sp. 9AX]|uniref:CBU_0592 family membrane protein n=1 Tax=Arthrobacter sp. 9AX TaxID=2653131 RepID=UPI0012F25C1E|nr:conserved hypothetical protein [Arthrobacter sp. 9AX]